MFDEASGLPYYYQTKTGATVWEKPEAFVIPLRVLQVRRAGSGMPFPCLFAHRTRPSRDVFP